MNMTPMPFFPRIATSALALAAALAGCASAPVHYRCPRRLALHLRRLARRRRT